MYSEFQNDKTLSLHTVILISGFFYIIQNYTRYFTLYKVPQMYLYIIQICMHNNYLQIPLIVNLMYKIVI